MYSRHVLGRFQAYLSALLTSSVSASRQMGRQAQRGREGVSITGRRREKREHSGCRRARGSYEDYCAKVHVPVVQRSVHTLQVGSLESICAQRAREGRRAESGHESCCELSSWPVCPSSRRPAFATHSLPQTFLASSANRERIPRKGCSSIR